MGVTEEVELATAPERSVERGTATVRGDRGRRHIVVVAVVASALLVLAGWGAVRRVRGPEPRAFADSAGISVGFLGPGEQGKHYSFGVSWGPLPAVSVTSVRAIPAEGSVAAATTVSVCRTDPAAHGVIGIGAVDGDLSASCAEIIPVEGLDLRDVGADASLVVTVVPLVDGPVSVRGLEFGYELDGRAVTELVETDLSVG